MLAKFFNHTKKRIPNKNPGFISTARRESKALKIVKILQEHGVPCDRSQFLLDIGTGNGEIAFYLSRYFKVTSIDVKDQRKELTGFQFIELIDSESSFPVEDNSFDVVISNHVIEHVPNANQHLEEIARVLAPKGVAYLATPNRLWPKEVHYRILFLHYLPNPIFLALLKKMGRFHEPLRLLSWFELVKKANPHFTLHAVSGKICKWPAQYYFNLPPFIAGCLATIPLKIYQYLTFIHPTLIVILKK